MRIYNIYNDTDIIEYIKCRIDPIYNISKGIILEDGYNIAGFILYHEEIKTNNKIAHIDFIFNENNIILNCFLNKFHNKMKHENFNLILYTIELDIELINKYIDCKYRMFRFKNNKCTLYKKINTNISRV
jgi:hypothetical protein